MSSYKESMLARADDQIDVLDTKLADGELDEELYHRKVADIKKRWRYRELQNEKD